MDKDYIEKVIEAGVFKLKESSKPLSELEITSRIVGRLKKTAGSKDNRHSSKVRFRSTCFKDIINSPEWKKRILQLSDKKFILKEDESKYVKTEFADKWTWTNIAYLDAIEFKLNNLKNIDPFKLEELVSKLLKVIYPDFDFIPTKKSGDHGIDVIGIKEDSNNNKEAIYVQVKQFTGKTKIGSPHADSFVGALDGLIKKHNYSHLTCLFVTTSDFSAPFLNKIKESQEYNKSFISWNGIELSRQMLKNGLGVKYSLDLDFWKDIDSTAVLESNNPKRNSKKAMAKK